MVWTHLSYFLALGATLCFSASSLVYTSYSRKVSPLWMNCFKCTVAFLALLITVPVFVGVHFPPAVSFFTLMASGLVGLNIGDLFLLKAFTKLGPGRTLILFGFQPLLVGLGAYVFFDQTFSPEKGIAVFFLIACLVTFSYENFKTSSRWEFASLLFALLGVCFDSFGILLTRFAFSQAPNLTPIEGHLYRTTGALLGFAVISWITPFGLKSQFHKWPIRTKAVLVMASLAGTYLSLLLYLSAVRMGHLASIAGISITGPVFATLLECLIEKKWPSPYVLLAFIFFCCGFWILMGTA